MDKIKAFTLLEVLISLSISSFIMIGMIQMYRNSIKFVDKTRNLMVLDRKISLLVKQMEDDVSCAFIPDISKPEEKKTKSEKALISTKEKSGEKKIKFFTGQILEGEESRIEGRNWKLFRFLNFISTNPLQVYGQKVPRLVRVMYVLVKDKDKSKKDKISYKLIRKETLNLENVEFKEKEAFLAQMKTVESGSDKSIIEKQERKFFIKTNIIADNIKEFFIEYIKEEKENKESKEDKKEIKKFFWGLEEIGREKFTDKEKIADEANTVPKRLDIKIVFWRDEKLSTFYIFDFTIPIFSYPTLKEKSKEEPKDVQQGTPKETPKNAQDGKTDKQTSRAPTGRTTARPSGTKKSGSKGSKKNID